MIGSFNQLALLVAIFYIHNHYKNLFSKLDISMKIRISLTIRAEIKEQVNNNQTEFNVKKKSLLLTEARLTNFNTSKMKLFFL